AATRKLGYHPFSTPRAILSEPYHDRPACTYCGFCQAFGCHVGAKSSILITKLPEADASGNFKLITGAMCHRVNSDNSGRVTGVGYYGPDGSENTIEGELVILSTFIYDNTRLLLLSKTDKFANGLANSTTGTSTTTWARAHRSTRSTTSTPTISTTGAPASSAARRSRSARAICKADRSATPPRRRRPARRAGERPIAITWRSRLRDRWRWSRRPRISPTATRRSTSIPT